ncbi:SEFIR domain-containing protein [Amycolatopsis sp. NPDC005961]|uniref:SEFIR domain-containing protein n=1 Tax=Amycolatopsis sp. NPDC005961 TaxID=3156720 RepID=UPI0033E71D3E
MVSPHPKTFVSYTHDSAEHRAAVLAFANFLRAHGIDVELDQWAGERQDWYAWALKNITEADFVIVVASEGYRRMGDGNGPVDRNLGGQAEAAALRELLQRDRGNWTRKLLPVVLPGHNVDEIPLFLQPYSADHFIVSALTLEETDDLLRHLTRQPLHIRPELGALPVLPPRAAFPAPAAEQRGVALLQELTLAWRSELLSRHYQPQEPLVEVHLVPAQPTARYRVVQLERISDGLAGLGRAEGLFSQQQSVTVDSNADVAAAYSTDWRSGQGGLAVLRTGQRSCWFALPKATIGHILDRDDLSLKIADRLQSLLRIDLPLPGVIAPAIGLDPVTSTTRLGTLAEASASTVSLSLNAPERIRIDPEEPYSPEELRGATQEVAEELVARLAAPLKR